ncbi:MAG TPA: CdaR family protein [Pyrinomonadaceae bacterium]|nr:CdaR family protein [Pyrinomonadaceae bacterium]
MPFQDEEDEATSAIPRTPTIIERWLRRILLEDWGLKLLALAVTIVLWMAVTGQNAPVTQRYGVQLTFLRPQGMEISNDPPDSVEVILTGSPAKLAEMGPRLAAIVDIADQKPGERVIRLNDRAQITLPSGVTIQGFRPSTANIRLEPVVESQVNIEVKFEGTLPEGYEVGTVSCSPGMVRLRGPADRINLQRKATTETVSLDRKTETFTLAGVAVITSDPKIEMLDPTVNIKVEVVEKKRALLRLESHGGESSTHVAKQNRTSKS